MFFRSIWSWSWNPPPRIHFAIAITVTVVALTLSVVLLVYAKYSLRTNPIISGVVVENIGSKETANKPVIEYETPQGIKRRFTSKFSSNQQRYFCWR